LGGAPADVGGSDLVVGVVAAGDGPIQGERVVDLVDLADAVGGDGREKELLAQQGDIRRYGSAEAEVDDSLALLPLDRPEYGGRVGGPFSRGVGTVVT
jgi:hypothetical protein